MLPSLLNLTGINLSFQSQQEVEFVDSIRVATVREKSLENEIFSRSGKSQGISILVREI